MSNKELTAVLKSDLTIAAKSNKNGENRVSKFFFRRTYNRGYETHPSLADHKLIATEHTNDLKRLMH